MYNFIVLGLIPGTNIQIGFWAYLIIFAALAFAFLFIRYRIHRLGLSEMFAARTPLHATQLHFRG